MTLRCNANSNAREESQHRKHKGPEQDLNPSNADTCGKVSDSRYLYQSKSKIYIIVRTKLRTYMDYDQCEVSIEPPNLQQKNTKDNSICDNVTIWGP